MNTCNQCVHCSPTVSLAGDYYCYKRNIYLDVLQILKLSCKCFKKDLKTMKEKEERVW